MAFFISNPVVITGGGGGSGGGSTPAYGNWVNLPSDPGQTSWAGLALNADSTKTQLSRNGSEALDAVLLTVVGGNNGSITLAPGVTPTTEAEATCPTAWRYRTQ